LNGKWEFIIDWYNKGMFLGIWKDQNNSNPPRFYEYGFTQAQTLDVPGDWNSQNKILEYYEGTVWYKKEFNYSIKKNTRIFLYFGAVSNSCDVFLNGKKLGSHEGAFTPFQFEVTEFLKAGTNILIVSVNNARKIDAIPALDFDWWNYGGITRDVSLVETPAASCIWDYFIQLKKGTTDIVEGWVHITGTDSLKNKQVLLTIPKAGIQKNIKITDSGWGKISFKTKLNLWSPNNPFLYKIQLKTETDFIEEEIGFRNIEVRNTQLFLNNQPLFLRGINFHEEIPQRKGRAVNEADAQMLLNWAKELGCNFIRLAHYPQNEYIVRLAEKMGFLLWEEIPVWQGIQFENKAITTKMRNMFVEMIGRDKNRCAIILWSLSNETAPSKSRNAALTQLASYIRQQLDSTRLLTSAFDHLKYNKNETIIDDSFSMVLDVLAVNKYYGWYAKWPAEPGNVIWKTVFEKPLIISEFGGEALYGKHGTDVASWGEEYQAQLYKDNINMFQNIPNLAGVCPWILADFRSPRRLHPINQDGWNRKGLISDRGFKKQAWYVLKHFYEKK
jgi:beta-glucuronidase